MLDNFFDALSELKTENDLETELLMEKIRSALVKAVRSRYPDIPDIEDIIRIDINPETREFHIYLLLTAVPEYPLENEILLDEARTIKPDAIAGDIIEYPVDPAKLLRKGAATAKQSLRTDLRDINRTRLLKQFEDKNKECITVKVSQVEPGRGTVTVLYEKTELYLFAKDQIPGETLKEGQMIKVYVTDITNRQKKPIIKISRTHRDLVKRLFEKEVPEIYDGTVEVMAIAREAGSRTKIAVRSNNPNVDAIGACIGPKRSRISAVVSELGGEKIDIIPYSDVPEEFIARALAPAEVLKTTIIKQAASEPEEEPVLAEGAEAETEAAAASAAEERSRRDGKREPENVAEVTVPNHQLSLAIGNRGQNAKLAAKLTGFKIDIRPEFEIPIKGLTDADASSGSETGAVV